MIRVHIYSPFETSDQIDFMNGHRYEGRRREFVPTDRNCVEGYWRSIPVMSPFPRAHTADRARWMANPLLSRPF